MMCTKGCQHAWAAAVPVLPCCWHAVHASSSLAACALRELLALLHLHGLVLTHQLVC